MLIYAPMPPAPSPRLTAFTATVLTLGGLAFALVPARAQQSAPVPAVDAANRQAVVDLYHNFYLASAGLDAGWTGNLATGDPGTLSDAFRQGALRRINYFRAMVGAHSDLTLDAVGNALCQQAAVMMAAQQNVSHTPAATWKFYTAGAAAACANSDLRLDWQGDEGALAMDRYVADDEDNNTYVGHRRWLLFPAQATMAVGAVPGDGWNTPGTNATWVASYGARPADAPAATSWPPAGYVPAALVYRRWSYSYAYGDFSAAAVSVSKNGAGLPVTQETPEYQVAVDGTGLMEGDNTLVWELPTNTVSAAADETYEVTVSNVRVNGTAQTFHYTVTSINPEATAVSLTVSRPVAYQGGKKGGVLVSRAGDPSSDLTVNYTLGGSAKAGKDYAALPGSVTIPAGKASAKIKVAALAGRAKAVGKTVGINLVGGNGYAVSTPEPATVTIQATP